MTDNNPTVFPSDNPRVATNPPNNSDSGGYSFGGLYDSADSSFFSRTNSLGVIFFYIGFGFFVLGAIAFFISFIRSATDKQRRFSVSAIIIVSVAATAYLAMAMGTGYYVRRGDNQQSGRWIYYARYIDWIITTPIILYDLGSFSGVGLPQIFLAIIFDIIMILCGLFGALTSHTSRRWVWFGMGNLAFIPILYLILWNFRKYRVDEVRRGYTVQSWYMAIVWIVYPIAWGLGTGGEIISTDAETVWVTCLDIVAKVFYGFVWLFAFRKALPYADGEISDRLAQAPRHPNTTAPPPGVVQPQDPHVYRQQPVAPAAGGAAPAPVAIIQTDVTEIPLQEMPIATLTNPAVLRTSASLRRSTNSPNIRGGNHERS